MREVDFPFPSPFLGTQPFRYLHFLSIPEFEFDGRHDHHRPEAFVAGVTPDNLHLPGV